jgi:AcrR family transcriptional regulator
MAGRSAIPWEGRLPAPDSSKELRFRAVAEAVAAVVLAGGVSRVTVSAVARRAAVSRPWIYKYLGHDPAILVAYAARFYGEVFSDLTRSRRADDVAGWRALIAEATRDGLHDVLQAPWCVLLYFRHRHASDPIGVTLREVEARYLAAFADDLPPALRGPEAESFAEVFLASRLGIYHRWLDPAVRARLGEEAVLAELLAPLDDWIRRSTPTDGQPPR